MAPMITPRIKPSAFFRCQASMGLFVQDHREAKLGGFIADLAAMGELIDFAAIAAQVDAACPAPIAAKAVAAVSDRNHGAFAVHPGAVQLERR
jgi:hypothetical protein